MRNLQFTPTAFGQFTGWVVADKKLFQRLVRLLDEVARTPFAGIGKPEPLKGDLAGFWSRRIDNEHRLVYKVTPETIVVSSRAQIGGHAERSEVSRSHR